MKTLSMCGNLAREAPVELAKAERDRQTQERLSISPSHGDLDLSQEGRIRLPADISRLSLAFNTAAVDLCDAALLAAGGCDGAAAASSHIVPLLEVEAHARGVLGSSLCATPHCLRRIRTSGTRLLRSKPAA